MTLEPLSDAIAEQTVAYRRALGAFATGVCVVTADTDQGPLGITVNSFASVSLEPRLVLWCLDRRSERWPLFSSVERFAIHMLRADDEAVARRFARGVSRLEDAEFTHEEAGAPRLAGVAAWFDCVTHERLPMGDHTVIVGRVEAFDTAPGPVLTFLRGGYGRLGEDG